MALRTTQSIKSRLATFAYKYRRLLTFVLAVAAIWFAYTASVRIWCRSCITRNDLPGLQWMVHQQKGLATALLEDAYTKANREAFEILLKAGANPNGIRYQGLTLVHAAAKHSDSFWIDKLLQYDADPNYHMVVRDIYPLVEAIVANRPANVRLLIKAGADVNATTYRHQSMLTFAWSQRKGEIAMILLDAGANINPPAFRHESFVNIIQRMSEEPFILNDRDKIDEDLLEKARQSFRDKNLDLWNASWDESQGDFGVWSIPPMPERELEEPVSPLEDGQSLATAPYDADKARQHQEAWASHINSSVEITNSIGMRFRLIPAGEFMMGSLEEDRIAEKDEKPIHKVRISRPYYLGITEVTQRQWRDVMKTTPWIGREERVRMSAREGDDYPVTYVSHVEAEEFCRKLSELEGKKYRLPTEAEWEHACRAGTTTRFSFGDDEGKISEHAWHQFNIFGIGKVTSGFKKEEDYPRTVGQKKPNPFGLFDMYGNVLEWCSDRYSKDYYRYSREENPKGPSAGLLRITRGGGWRNCPEECRSASRYWLGREKDLFVVGFRVARIP